MSQHLLVQGVPPPTYNTPVEVDRYGYFARTLEELDEKMKGIKAPVIQVKTNEGVAYFARLRNLDGKALRLLYTKGDMLVTSKDAAHVVYSFCFDTEGYFKRLCKGEPCGVINHVYVGNPEIAPYGQYYVFREGPRLVDEPYTFTGVSTYLVDCCKSLFGLANAKKVSAVSLDKPKPEEV